MNDSSVQQLSKDLTEVHSQPIGNNEPSLRSSTVPGLERELAAEFKDRYGEGFKLTSESVLDPEGSSGKKNRGQAKPKSNRSVR